MPPWRKAAILLALVAALVVLAWLLAGPRTTAPAGPLGVAPLGATAVLWANLPAVLGSDVWRDVVVARGGDRPIERLERLCGRRALAGLEDATLFADGAEPGQLERVGLVVSGSLDEEALERCLTRAIEEDGGRARRVEIDGVPALASGERSRTAFVADDTLASGDERTVRAVIDVVRGDGAPASEDPVLSHLWDGVRGRHHAVLVAHVPEGWRRALREALEPAEAGSLRALADVRAVAAAARVGRGLELELLLAMPDEQRATAAAAALAAAVERARATSGLARTPLGRILATVDASADADEVRVGGRLAVRELTAIVDAWATPDAVEGREPEGPEPDAVVRPDE